MIRGTFLLLFISCWTYKVYGGPVYTDCERPPTILHGKTELTVDDEGIVVTAIYTCDVGYQLHGLSRLVCNTDNDEWQGDLPACKLETGTNSMVSEIEPPVVIEEIVTVPPEVTHEEIQNSIPNVPITESVNSEVIDNEDNAIGTETEIENEAESALTSSEIPQKKRRRKGKLSEVQEDDSIDDEFASRLDMSCIEGIVAPSVSDAHVKEYIRAKHGEFTFLVAVYACDPDYDLENANANRLYCSDEHWIGNYPVCIGKGDSDSDYGTDNDDDDDDNDNAHNSNLSSTDNANVGREMVETNEKHDESTHENENENGTGNVAVIETHETDEQIARNEINRQSGTEIETETGEVTIEDRNNFSAALTCELDNGGCEQMCNLLQSEETGELIVECSCKLGFYLDSAKGKNCIDINECENSEVEQSCPYGCENTVGSYRCIELEHNSEVEIIPSIINENIGQSTEPNAPVKACGDGLRLDDSQNCIDIDECSEGNTGCQYCQNSFGGFQCMCPDGFELNGDEKTCRDIDECTTLSDYEYEDNVPTARSICSHECVNTLGSYLCKCPLNFHLRDDKRTCEQDFCRHLGDVASNKTKCSHDCVDDVDGYHCKCPDGMVLDIDLKTCFTLDACKSVGDRCSPGKCVGTNDGSYRCECPNGFAEHNQRCIDYDECAIGSHECSHKCKNTDGSYICECPNDLVLANDQHSCISLDLCQNDNGGCSDTCNVINEKIVCSCPNGSELSLDGQTCQSINICATNNGGCQQVCNEELNRCECYPGFETFDDGKTCHDLNECLNNPCPQQCLNTEGGYECGCFEGFTRDSQSGECTDINECLSSDNQCEQDCTNTQGSYLCSCQTGYQLGGNRLACVDINECSENNGGCSHTCENLLGGHKCTCPEGQFLVNDDHTCEYLNLCEVNNGGCSDICNFDRGVLKCSCSNGYKLDESGINCIDVNECLINNGGCQHTCENLVGTHVCKCNSGYQLASDKAKCLDLDECIEHNGNCSNICINLLGSYSCACEAGFELDVDGHKCIDIDECSNGMHDCSQICVNVPAGYECECRPGYELSRDHFSCQDIDECLTPGTCDTLSKCVNNDGSFSCKCNNGYSLADDKRTCVQHTDPCAIKNGGCSHVCEPVDGKAQCYCYKGFELSSRDNTSCVDIDECLLNHGCESKCINTIGSYKCDCPKGFQMNGAGSCEDVNECLLDICSSNSECINFIGGYRCICKAGYRMDRETETCIQIKDSCPALSPPPNGDVRCTRSRHLSQHFYRTKCSVWCNEGFTLNGPSVRYCNGSSGVWDAVETSCVASACPALETPVHGSVSPPNCLSGKVYPGESCTLICQPGFKSVGSEVAQCLPGRVWSTSILNCAPVKNEFSHPKTRVQQGEIHSRGHINLDESAQQKQRPQPILRPYIKCPRDTTILLPKNKKTVYIKLEQPKSNVDWTSHIDVHPVWAKNLQAHLAAGTHTITFRARSPNSPSVTDVCRTVITVKSAQPQVVLSTPEVLFCPQNIDVQLQPNELQRAISWREPVFRSNHHLKQIFKSNLPGTKFAAGLHRITYIATDLRNQNGTCQFSINVQAAQVMQRVVTPYAGAHYQNHMDNHESYLLCPDKPAIKLDTNFPNQFQIPNGCLIKNVRLRHYNPHRRRHAFSSSNNFLRHYSSWDQPLGRYFF